MRTNPKLKKLTSYFLLLTSKKGFTLIELLVVISLVGAVMVATVGLLFSVIRASRKSESLNRVKQTGSHTLEIMNSMIRNAQGISGNCGSSTQIEIRNRDGLTTTLNCDNDADRISSSSAYTPTVEFISPDANLDVYGCSFLCTSGEGGKPDTVQIEFSLIRGETPDTQATGTFSTTTSLRTY